MDDTLTPQVRSPQDRLEVIPWGRGSAGRAALCMQGGLRGAGGSSPNLINAPIVFGALEDKNGISQSLRHGTEIKAE